MHYINTKNIVKSEIELFKIVIYLFFKLSLKYFKIFIFKSNINKRFQDINYLFNSFYEPYPVKTLVSNLFLKKIKSFILI